MVLLIAIITFIIGMPISLVLGVTSLYYLIFSSNVSLEIIGQSFFHGVDSYTYLAMPMFTLAGQLMGEIGITRELIKLADLIVGRLPGGLAQVNIAVSVLFAGLTGAAVADTTAIGSVLVPAMKDQGYSSEYSAAVTASSSIIGPIIPPSIIMVIYSAVTGESIIALFMAGFIPGILIALSLMVITFYYAIKENHPRRKKSIHWRESIKIIRNSLLAIMVPIIIIGGILSGKFTPTEAAAAACGYIFIVDIFFYKKLTIKKIIGIFYECAMINSVILLIMATAALFGLMITIEHIPEQLTNIILSTIHNKYLFLFTINLFLLFVGMIMENGVAVILLAPLLLPIALKYGIHPLHFALVMLINLNIGLVTPPLGVCLFVVSPIAKVPIEKIIPKIIPFILAEIAALLLMTYIPNIILILPKLMGLI